MHKLVIIVVLVTFFFTAVYAQMENPLYQSAIPNNKAVKNKEKSEMGKDGILRVSKVSIPSLVVFVPKKEKANGTGIIICPGGGYSILAADHEGIAVAKVLNEWGITAFVLKYRLPDDSIMTNKSIVPLQDIQQAIQLIRLNADQYFVNPMRLGVMGFSAGGHLAATAGTHFSNPVIPNHFKTISLRPDFMILAYPVISFTDSIGHLPSRLNLLGAKPTKEEIINYCNEMQVTEKTPPTFLMHAKDDKVVKVANSQLFYDALQKNNIPSELYLYSHGGHGFGMNNKDTNDKWMDALKGWLIKMGWLKN
jgi:acetyl esterase/lipase